MKRFTLFFVIAMLATLANAPMKKTTSEIILDASQVTSAVDIEMAIAQATNNGTRPGIVTLDGSKGKFEYTADDRSINLLYSNITLRSFNWATIGNCADGVFFDDTAVNNILIEGIELVCREGHSVIAPYLSQHNNVILRNNYFETGLSPAIYILHGEDWTITGNQVISMGTGIYLDETGSVLIRDNKIQGTVGIELYNSGIDNIITQNQISAWERGIVLSGKTLDNRITSNRFDDIQDAGIVFGDILSGNQVIANQVSCWPGVPCQVIVADPLNFKQNKIVANKLVKSK